MSKAVTLHSHYNVRWDIKNSGVCKNSMRSYFFLKKKDTFDFFIFVLLFDAYDDDDGMSFFFKNIYFFVLFLNINRIYCFTFV